jgi:hypothetical protein
MRVNMDGDENLKCNFKPYERVENPLDSSMKTVSTPDACRTSVVVAVQEALLA